ncbi:MAG: aldehyde dehydrogenase family protein [Treponemataceae bacterium]|nr:aldehyde dehydrogenase family protein [Spirochaetales bacterium]MDY6031269.1 aldehyde dehydrogenase family protein [Treponemataceae bacterium]
MHTQEELDKILNSQRDFFRSGKTFDISWRIEQLKKLRDAVIENEIEIEQALHEDLGRSALEAYFCDIGSVILEVNEIIKGLRKWAKPETHFSGLTCFPSVTTKVYKIPYGNVLIISPFNFPFLLSLGVLAAAICGGNTAIIKASSKSQSSTAVLQKIISKTFEPEFVTVIDGDHDVADMCLSMNFDKIFYTGSPKIGKHVMEAASKNLTPVVLELGGENGNWAIVRKDANIKDAARKIAFFKMCNSGQICININQVAVASEIADDFLQALKEEFERQIGKSAIENPEYAKLITKAAYEKCSSEAELYKDRIVYGGKGNPDEQKFEPTIIYPVNIDEKIVQHELFNPLLPVVPFADKDIDKILDVVAQREHGLALYIFTKNLRWAKKVMATQQYGGGCINEVCLHIMVKGVPFGGTGHSGMGSYHGKWGFMEFTHPSSVLIGKTFGNLSLREHPYTGKKAKGKKTLLKLFER